MFRSALWRAHCRSPSTTEDNALDTEHNASTKSSVAPNVVSRRFGDDGACSRLACMPLTGDDPPGGDDRMPPSTCGLCISAPDNAETSTPPAPSSYISPSTPVSTANTVDRYPLASTSTADASNVSNVSRCSNARSAPLVATLLTPLASPLPYPTGRSSRLPRMNRLCRRLGSATGLSRASLNGISQCPCSPASSHRSFRLSTISLVFSRALRSPTPPPTS